MKRLRSPDGCPWDQEQDLHSLLPYLIEETFEYIDAAQANDKENMCEELGDILLQVVFNAQVASEQGDFDINQVIQGIAEKLVRRHPHVFGTGTAKDSSAVIREWDRIKASEKNNIKKSTHSTMDKVSKSLAPLARAFELQRRAAKVGYDWNHSEPVFSKVLEEINEFKQEMQAPNPNKEKLEEEFGDILFSLINWGRHHQVHALTAMMRAISKFESRFRQVELLANHDMKSKSLQELDALWEQVKAKEATQKL